ncbi:MAG: hypothetical protein FE78DRAFT_99059 [Acidomyces sp. 'richmondensis']|nr:MAG: hypothetical protein FE78DRAFT_99059 [Acidomyces sp. 'richmondensis']
MMSVKRWVRGGKGREEQERRVRRPQKVAQENSPPALIRLLEKGVVFLHQHTPSFPRLVATAGDEGGLGSLVPACTEEIIQLISTSTCVTLSLTSDGFSRSCTRVNPMKGLCEEAERVRNDINNELDKVDTESRGMSDKQGITGAVTTVTGTVGAAVGGVSRTVGGVVGAAGRGVGGTVNNTTGTKAVGDGLQSLTNAVEDASNNLAHGVEKGSEGKKIW